MRTYTKKQEYEAPEFVRTLVRLEGGLCVDSAHQKRDAITDNNEIRTNIATQDGWEKDYGGFISNSEWNAEKL